MPVILKSRIPAIVADLPRRGNMSEAALARQVEQHAKSRAPVGVGPDDPHPGRLRDSIKAVQIDEDWWVVVDARAGANEQGAPYGHMVEFGTSHSSPRPFLTPAAEEVRGTGPTHAIVAAPFKNL